MSDRDLFENYVTVEQKEVLRHLKRKAARATDMVDWGIWWGRYEAKRQEVMQVARILRERQFELQKDNPSGMADVD